MHAIASPRLRVILVAALALGYWSLLAYQHTHAGVAAHSFLARDDMPEISNWWGAMVVPLVAWTLTALVQRRLMLLGADHAAADHALRAARGFAQSGVSAAV